MKHVLFSERMKLADLVHSDYKLLFVLPRFGIRLGFGEKSVREVCAEKGIPTPFFLLVCNVYTFDEYLPRNAELSSFGIDALLAYLKNSHRDYLNERLPALRRDVLEVVGRCDTRPGRTLEHFFEDYLAEVVNHFRYEEEEVFPYVESLASGRPVSNGYTIEQFERNHTNIEEKLADLKNILIKYLPETCPSEKQNRALRDLFLLEDDLNKHTLIENKILVPVVMKLERGRL